jgi:hypothetical protein
MFLFRRFNRPLIIILGSIFLVILFILIKYFIKNDNYQFISANNQFYYRTNKVNIR